MAVSARLDTELVRRGLARSRRQAVALIDAGRVSVDGALATKGAAQTDDDQVVVVVPDALDPGYASRAGHKLAGALDTLASLWGDEAPGPAGRECLDAGASTGGFTDVLLRRGARTVVAVDVGHDQMRAELRADPRVDVREGVNVRTLRQGDITPAPTLVVADLSFISLTLVLPALAEVSAPRADILVMVKPQFEVGRERIGSSGVVRSAQLRREAVLTVVRSAVSVGLAPMDVVPSPLPGPSGNLEYFVWLVDGQLPAAHGNVEEDAMLALVMRGTQNGREGVHEREGNT